MNHSCNKLNVKNKIELSRLIQRIDSLHFHELSNNFIRDLITPTVDVWHVNIVDENCHFPEIGKSQTLQYNIVIVSYIFLANGSRLLPSTWRSVCCPHPLVDKTFNCSLIEIWCCLWWEVDCFTNLFVRVVTVQVFIYHHRFCRS